MSQSRMQKAGVQHTWRRVGGMGGMLTSGCDRSFYSSTISRSGLQHVVCNGIFSSEGHIARKVDKVLLGRTLPCLVRYRKRTIVEDATIHELNATLAMLVSAHSQH